jgi:hypothetical protein
MARYFSQPVLMLGEDCNYNAAAQAKASSTGRVSVAVEVMNGSWQLNTQKWTAEKRGS